MKRFLVLYATREGQTRRIADHVADTLRSRGFSTDVVDAAHLPANLVVLNYCGAIVAASVHQQKHEREIFWFIKRHASELVRTYSDRFPLGEPFSGWRRGWDSLTGASRPGS